MIRKLLAVFLTLLLAGLLTYWCSYNGTPYAAWRTVGEQNAVGFEVSRSLLLVGTLSSSDSRLANVLDPHRPIVLWWEPPSQLVAWREKEALFDWNHAPKMPPGVEVLTSEVVAEFTYLAMPLWAVSLLLVVYPLKCVALGPIRRHVRRKKGRCSACGFDLTGNTSGVCPECGSLSRRVAA